MNPCTVVSQANLISSLTGISLSIWLCSCAAMFRNAAESARTHAKGAGQLGEEQKERQGQL